MFWLVDFDEDGHFFLVTCASNVYKVCRTHMLVFLGKKLLVYLQSSGVLLVVV
jgi:hypothetical protein